MTPGRKGMKIIPGNNQSNTISDIKPTGLNPVLFRINLSLQPDVQKISREYPGFLGRVVYCRVVKYAMLG